MSRAPLRETLSWLNYTTAPAFRVEESGFDRVRGPALSSGALGSVTPVLVSCLGSPRLFRPEPLTNAAAQLEVRNIDPLKDLCRRATSILPDAATCDLVILISHFDRLEFAYQAPESLAWRDAGAMLQTLALTATALGLGFCPLGLLGGEVVQALGPCGDVRAVGVAVVGL